MATVSIKGMSCPHCVASTKKALEEIPGILNVVVNLENAMAKYDGNVNEDVVKKVIAKLDGLVKTLSSRYLVIPAQAGIQFSQ